MTENTADLSCDKKGNPTDSPENEIDDVFERITNRANTPRKETRNMGNEYPMVVKENSGGDIPWWALGFTGGLGGYGRGGYGGGGYGGGGHGGGGYGGGRREADQVRDERASTSDIKASFAEQNLAKGQADAALASALGHQGIQMSLSEEFARNAAAQAECCCETQKEIMRSGFMTQQGFSQVDRTMCDQGSLTRATINNEGQLTRALINSLTLQETRDKLHDTEHQLSSAKLPGEILAMFKDCGCCSENGNGNGHGRSASATADPRVEILINQVSRLTGMVEGGFSPGPGKAAK